MRFTPVTLIGFGIAALVSSSARGAGLEDMIKLLARQNEASAKSQASGSKLDAEARELEQEYEAVSRQADSLALYVEQLEATVAGQEQNNASLEAQIDRVVDVGRRTIPLMKRMVEALEEFVRLDIPFLLDERRERVERLKALLDAPDVTDAEKYRIVLEAYQVEMEYGRTIEAYQGRLSAEGSRDGSGATGAEDQGQGRVVNFLRFGRLVLAYESLDGKEYGVWDKQANAWTKVDASTFGSGIKRALRIARKQAAPDLVFLPVRSPAEEINR